MVNCNPETVSTDYDTSDRLYFEPLTQEDVLEIIETERQAGTLHGVIVQFGGQTPLKLARALEAAGVPILGTSSDAIDLAEDRDQFKRLLDKLGMKQPKNGIAYSVEQSRLVASDLGLPFVVRPSYVLGGRAMADHTRRATNSSDYLLDTLPEPRSRRRSRSRYPNDKTGQINTVLGKNPLLFDRYLADAIEIDVDAICRRRHGRLISPASWSISRKLASIPATRHVRCRSQLALSPRLSPSSRDRPAPWRWHYEVVGLMNVQYALKDGMRSMCSRSIRVPRGRFRSSPRPSV